MDFKFTSGPAYVLFVLCIFILVYTGKYTSGVGEVFLGALIWYSGRRAYKEVKLANLSMTRDCDVQTDSKE